MSSLNAGNVAQEVESLEALHMKSPHAGEAAGWEGGILPSGHALKEMGA